MDRLEQGLGVMTEHVRTCSRLQEEAAVARQRIEDQQAAARREFRNYIVTSTLALLVAIVGGAIVQHFAKFW